MYTAASVPKLLYDLHLSSLATLLQCGINRAGQLTANWQVDNCGVRPDQIAMAALRGTLENHALKLFKISSRRKRGIWGLWTFQPSWTSDIPRDQ